MDESIVILIHILVEPRCSCTRKSKYHHGVPLEFVTTLPWYLLVRRVNRVTIGPTTLIQAICSMCIGVDHVPPVVESYVAEISEVNDRISLYHDDCSHLLVKERRMGEPPIRARSSATATSIRYFRIFFYIFMHSWTPWSTRLSDCIRESVASCTGGVQ